MSPSERLLVGNDRTTTFSVTTVTLADDSIGSQAGDVTNGWTFSPNDDWNGTVELNDITDGPESNSTINISNSFQAS